MSNDVSMLLLGWGLGTIGSLLTGIVLVILEGIRDSRIEANRQRREDARVARNWAAEGKPSLRGFDLSRANLSGKDLSVADLEDADFEGAKMWGTNLSEANLIRANFRRAKLVGVDFEGADLRLADFTGAVMSEVNFTEARLRRTKLRKARKIVDCVWKGIEADETTEMSAELREEIKRQIGVDP